MSFPVSYTLAPLSPSFSHQHRKGLGNKCTVLRCCLTLTEKGKEKTEKRNSLNLIYDLSQIELPDKIQDAHKI